MLYRVAALAGVALFPISSAAVAQDHEHHASPSPSQPAQAEPAQPVKAEPDHSHQAQEPAKAPELPPHSDMEHAGPEQAMSPDDHAAHQMSGVQARHPMERESSGTAWQPDASEHMGLMVHSGDWTLMGHGVLNLVYDRQGGRRGDDKVFASGMLMGMARRSVGNGTVQFRAAVSPDPAMGKSGYPLLLASGETADGVDHLIDRQHPHDFFMELSASVSQNIGPKRSVFLYAALPGEPAFGPPAFMHREAIMDSPEAPISHHWLDSTHITFGVLTAGVVHDRFKLEISRFNGREPDQHRWNIETGPLDSTAVRLSANPTRTLSLQGSWGKFKSPEQLEPGVDQKRWSASAMWTDELAAGWKAAGTIAWGRKSAKDHHEEWFSDDAYVAEASLRRARWTMFARGEVTENRELLEVGEDHGDAFTVGKVSVGAVRDFRVAEHLSLGLGGLIAVNFVPDGLHDDYAGSNPLGAIGFVRLKVE